MNDERILVSADALKQLLAALNGPPHYICELQVTRGPLPLIGNDNPINILIDNYNEQLKS